MKTSHDAHNKQQVSQPEDQKPLALIVDDDLSLRLSIRAALRKVGFDTVDAVDGEQAIAQFASHNPDLILLDVVMPGMDGFETCRRIRALPGADYSQILMVTGLDDSESTEKAFEAGANDFISKPINWIMLGYRVRYMLRTGSMFRELARSQRRLEQNQKLAKQGGWQIDYAMIPSDFEVNLHSGFSISPAACLILGLPETLATAGGGESVSSSIFLSTVTADHRAQVSTTLVNALHDKGSFSINFQVQMPDHTTRYILSQGETITNERGEPDIMLGIVQDVTDMKLAEAEIYQLAFYDGLTGLANRMLFGNRLKKQILFAKRNNSRLAVLFLDIDHFKLVNDTLGSDGGDILLKHIASMIKEAVRSTDTVGVGSLPLQKPALARRGGDEFSLLLADTQAPEYAAMVAERLLCQIQKPHMIRGKEISVTACIGISLYPEDSGNADELMQYADAAITYAKKKGRNCYQFFQESLNSQALERFTLQQDLKKAIANNEFVLYYQPQVRLADRTVIGAEALIRWIHPEKGFIPPDRFIAAAEESGAIVDINRWVIQEACRQNRVWREQGFADVRIAVNLSGYRLAEQNILSILEDALKENDLEGSNIEVEVTENVLMQDTTSIIKILKSMKKLNLKIALDDFGTGYSSLSYLTTFDVDTIKIDRSFVMDCTQNEKNRVIIKTIIAMGHSLGMSIVAEGIETKEDFDLLCSYGCDDCQGYYFSPPVPENRFVEILKKRVI